MNKLLLLQVVFIVYVSGCTLGKPDNSEGSNMPGSDKDIYGCISSAGYSWCERTNQCERPWELAEQEGFNNTHERFQEYCKE